MARGNPGDRFRPPEANGDGPGEVVELDAIKIIHYPLFNWGVESVRMESGQEVKRATFTSPNGEKHIFPFGLEAATEFGKAMMSPSVALPTDEERSKLG